MTVKMATIVRDVTGLQQRHHSANYTSFSCKDQIKAFHWRQNRFEILQHIKNSGRGGGGLHQLSPPQPCATVRVWICVYVRGLSITDKTKIANITFSTPLIILHMMSFLFVLSSLHFVYVYFSFVLFFFYMFIIICFTVTCSQFSFNCGKT